LFNNEFDPFKFHLASVLICIWGHYFVFTDAGKYVISAQRKWN